MTTGPPPSDPAALLRDWLTVMQTELAGLAEDRELRETWQAMLAMWADAARAMVPHDPPRPAPAAAAPGAGQPAGERHDAALVARIDALERRLAELERGAGRTRRRKPAG